MSIEKIVYICRVYPHELLLCITLISASLMTSNLSGVIHNRHQYFNIFIQSLYLNDGVIVKLVIYN